MRLLIALLLFSTMTFSTQLAQAQQCGCDSIVRSDSCSTCSSSCRRGCKSAQHVVIHVEKDESSQSFGRRPKFSLAPASSYTVQAPVQTVQSPAFAPVSTVMMVMPMPVMAGYQQQVAFAPAARQFTEARAPASDSRDDCTCEAIYKRIDNLTAEMKKISENTEQLTKQVDQLVDITRRHEAVFNALRQAEQAKDQN